MKALLLAALICFAASTDICADIAGNYDVEYTVWGSNGPYGKVNQTFIGSGSATLVNGTVTLSTVWASCTSSNSSAYACSLGSNLEFHGTCDDVLSFIGAKCNDDAGTWTCQYLGWNGPDTIVLKPAADVFTGTCNSKSAANSCGECHSDIDCGGEKNACWEAEDYWCTHEAPVNGDHWCNSNSPANTCQQVCADDEACGGNPNEWTYCWGDKDLKCDDVPVVTTVSILGFFDYDTIGQYFHSDCTLPNAVTTLTPNQTVLIQFDGVVSWTAPYMSQLHWGNVVSDITTYTGCGAQTDAYYVIADVPLEYPFIYSGNSFNVFLEQWTTGGSRGPAPAYPLEFSSNATVTIDF